MENKSLQEIEETLFSYKEELQRLHTLQSQYPHDQSFIKLASDIEEAIGLMEILIEQKKADQSAEKEQITSGPIVNVGEYCYGLYQGAWYVAKVTKVNVPEPKQKNEEEEGVPPMIDYFVRYVGYGNTAILNFENRNIKKYFDPPKEYLQQGARVLAVYEEDQQYYEAIIDTVTDHCTVWVTFSGFGNVQETALPNIRLLDNQDIYLPNYKHTKKETGMKRKSDGANNKQQPKKKKKKTQNSKKKEEFEAQLNKRANNWKDFVSTSKAKPLMRKKETGTVRTMTEVSTFKPLQSVKQKAVVNATLGRDK